MFLLVLRLVFSDTIPNILCYSFETANFILNESGWVKSQIVMFSQKITDQIT